VLNAEIGKYVTMARKDRNSEEWYIGSITNEDPRKLEINLAFLDDSANARHFGPAAATGHAYRKKLAFHVDIGSGPVNRADVSG
jgi:hypothetical protein